MAEWPEGSRTEVHYGIKVTGGGDPAFRDYHGDAAGARQAATMEPEQGQSLEFGHCEVTYGPFTMGEPEPDAS